MSAIVVDLHLPTAGGVEFLRRLCSHRPHAELPVAVVTGDYRLDEHVRAELHELGARLSFKPLCGDDLVQMAADLLKDCRLCPKPRFSLSTTSR